MESECKRRNAAKRLKCTRKTAGILGQEIKENIYQNSKQQKKDVIMKIGKFQSSRHFIYSLPQLQMNIGISFIRIVNL